MPVGRRDRSRIGVTKLASHDFQRHAVADEVAGIGMPQTMKDEGGGQAGSGGSEPKWSSVLASPDPARL
jgi:hypothetical protein